MDEIGPRGARMFGIEAGRHWQDLVESASGSLRVAYDAEGGDRLWLALKLYAETATSHSPDALQVDSLIAELLAVTACARERTSDPPFWLRRIKDRICDQHGEPLTLQHLASDAGVHPVHVSRSFRRFTGYGLGEYVRRMRLRHACQMMLTSTATLAEIGLASGFADQSHLTRACRAITGFTPASLRTLLRDRGATSAELLCPCPS
jgi:AraC family transcriptional regulator